MKSVAVLVCTFNRPEYLRALLAGLVDEVVCSRCKTLGVVVVDNGTRDVKDVVQAFESDLPIIYTRYALAGLVGARNLSICQGLKLSPDFLVFIDDDEIPTRGWLDGLVSSVETSGAGFAVGPVEPNFESPPPQWAPSFFRKSGEAFCTSNLIIRSDIIPSNNEFWFQPRFNFCGGEDGEFLRRLAQKSKHVVASGAVVYEAVPVSRVSLLYICRRSFRDGIVFALSDKSHSASVFQRLRLCAPLAFRKMAYGLNHFFWTMTEPQRFYRALDDFSFATGLFWGVTGGSIVFYNPKT